MSKDIVNFQNYKNLKLRNEINFKIAMKKIENMKFNDWKHLLNENDLINDKSNFEHFTDYKSQDLTIKHDVNFKVKKKPHPPIKKIKIKKDNIGIHNKIHNAEIFDIDDISNKKKITLEILKPINGIHCQEISDDYDLNSNINRDPNGVNEFRTDLQSLLCQMVISSKSDHIEDRMVDNNEKNFCNIKDDQLIACQNENNTKLTEFLSVIHFATDVQVRQHVLSKKYTSKWKKYVEKKTQRKKRQQTLKNFLDKLAVKKKNFDQSSESVNKSKLQCQDYNTYQHRYKVQQNIIALQKIKLDEQSKVIEQLKYNKLIESSKKSLEAMREEIVSNYYYQIDRQLKPKIKCLSNELKIRELNEQDLVLHCLKVPQFIQRMEKRAREREEKHAMIRERRRQMEEERIRLKQQSELAKAEMDKEEKFKRMKELKEKRRKEKIENIRKKQHEERMRALTVMADLHYEKSLMAKYGIKPLRRLIAIKRDYIEKAKLHYQFQLKKNVFLHWMWHTEDMWFDRNYKSEEFYRKKVMSKIFQSFKKNLKDYKIKLQVADDYYDLYLTQLAFRKFRNNIEIIKKDFQIKLYKSELYYNSTLLFKTFTSWRTLPALNALRREQEVRKQRWREKVLQVVPDYKPPEE